MISRNAVEWNNEYQHDGLLFFAQRIVEMLDYTTVDVFRSPLLNTSSLIDEYLKISHGLAKVYHLEEVYNEFMNSFKNDIVINYNWGEDRVNQIIKKLNKEQSNRQTIMEYLCHTIGSQYLKWSKQYLLYIIPQTREKRKIERGIRCFIPELLSCGYSRDEVYHSAKQILSNDNDPNQALENFIKRYDRKKRKYIVYTAISNRLLIFRETLESKLGISFVDDGNFDKIETWDKYCSIKMDNIEALDAGSAADIAYKNIELFTSFYQFFGNYSKRLIQNRVLVIDDAGEERKITVDRGKYKAVEDTNPPQIGQIAELSITNLIHGARCALPQLQKIVKLHGRAIANNGLENGFLNFWSILEVICVSNPDASKIEQVKNIVIPILKRDYLPVLINDITENLKRVMEPTKFNELISGVSTDDKDYKKIACLVFLPEYEEKLYLFVDNLTNYPVLRTRMLNLHDDCQRRNHLYNMTERYTQRISWHLYRIYRARNAIVHAGKRPKNLKDLGEHLHAYVDSVANEVIIKLCTGPLCHTSNVLVDSELHQEKWDTYFSEVVPIDDKAINLIFSSQLASWNK